MPNHCDQQVHIHGQRLLVETIYYSLTDNGHFSQFCQLIKPMPFEQWLAPKTKWQGFEVEGWYDWRVNNWGTKWDVVDVDITQPLTIDDDQNASFSFNCWTAWSPPIPVWDKLVEMGLSVDASYQDEGMCFEGEYLNGEDNCWEPEFAQDQRLEEEDA